MVKIVVPQDDSNIIYDGTKNELNAKYYVPEESNPKNTPEKKSTKRKRITTKNKKFPKKVNLSMKSNASVSSGVSTKDDYLTRQKNQIKTILKANEDQLKDTQKEIQIVDGLVSFREVQKHKEKIRKMLDISPEKVLGEQAKIKSYLNDVLSTHTVHGYEYQMFLEGLEAEVRDLARDKTVEDIRNDKVSHDKHLQDLFRQKLDKYLGTSFDQKRKKLQNILNSTLSVDDNLPKHGLIGSAISPDYNDDQIAKIVVNQYDILQQMKQNNIRFNESIGYYRYDKNGETDGVFQGKILGFAFDPEGKRIIFKGKRLGNKNDTIYTLDFQKFLEGANKFTHEHMRIEQQEQHKKQIAQKSTNKENISQKQKV